MPQCAEGSDVVLFASSVAIAISRELSLNEISILSSFLNAVGDKTAVTRCFSASPAGLRTCRSGRFSINFRAAFTFCGAYYLWVITMMFHVPEMQEYFDSLPHKVRRFIEESKSKITNLDELKKVGEQIKQQLHSDSKY